MERDSLGRIKKGTSGNPRGRPYQQAIVTKLKKRIAILQAQLLVEEDRLIKIVERLTEH